MASTVLLPFVFAELPFPSLTSVDPSLLTFTEALESVEEDSLVTLLDDVVEDDESVLSLELPHAAKVNKARTETEAKVNLENVLEGNEILELRDIIKEVKIAESVKEYALKLILATHPEIEAGAQIAKEYLEAGASPRAAQGIIAGAKVRAVMEGRFNVSFDDIKELAYPVLRHRWVLNFDAITEGLNE